MIRFVLHRPRNSQNIGSAARALANTSAGALWVVEPEGFDRAEAARLAAGADAVLDAMTVVRTMDAALADCVDVVMTTGRELAGVPILEPRDVAQRLLASGGTVALVFGDEVRGLNNAELARANAVATIPTAGKSSINLAQSVMIFAYEILQARRAGAPRPAPPPADEADGPAEERMVALLREKARALLLEAGYLTPPRPENILDELMAVLRRASPTRREVQLLLGVVNQLAWAQRRGRE